MASDNQKSNPLIGVVILMLVVFGILFAVGLVPRLLKGPQLAADAAEQKAPPIVNAVAVQQPPPFDDLDLPGTIQAARQTAVVARASGYLKKWLVDIGDRVHAGQILAVIDSPDLDQQTMQSKAQLGASRAALSQSIAYLSSQQAAMVQAQAQLSRSDASLQQARTQLAEARAALAQAKFQSAQQQAQVVQAQTNLDLAHVTATRYQNLLKDGAIDRETTDQAVASYNANVANVDALKASHDAGMSNVQAFSSAVQSAQANVLAYQADLRSSDAAVDAAAANVRSGEANVQAAEQNVQSNVANVARNVVLEDFENVTAPFSGTITARNVDIGSLISSGGAATSGSGSTTSVGSGTAGVTQAGNAAGTLTQASTTSGGQPTSLFSISDLDDELVYVNIPQSYMGVSQVGQTASVTVRELPGASLQGKIVRTAGALDPASRTLVAEVALDNMGKQLRPGMFADVHLRLPHPGGALLVPDTALVTDAQGNHLVLIGSDNRIHFQPVTVGRDFGQVLEVTSGAQAGQQIALSPSDSLVDGETVTVHQAPTRPGQK